MQQPQEWLWTLPRPWYCPCHANGQFFHSQCVQSMLQIIHEILERHWLTRAGQCQQHLVASSILLQTLEPLRRTYTLTQGKWTCSCECTRPLDHRILRTRTSNSCGAFVVRSEAQVYPWPPSQVELVIVAPHSMHNPQKNLSWHPKASFETWRLE
jgi:hypothetical protein